MSIPTRWGGGWLTLNLEEFFEDRNTDIVEFGLEVVNKLVQSVVHDFLDIEKLQFGSQASEQLLGSIAVVALGASGDL